MKKIWLWPELVPDNIKLFLNSTVHACMLSCVQLFVTRWTVTHQTPPSMGFSRQEYWSGWPCPPPGDLPDPGIELVPPMLPALAGKFSITSATWESRSWTITMKIIMTNPKLKGLSGTKQSSFWHDLYVQSDLNKDGENKKRYWENLKF